MRLNGGLMVGLLMVTAAVGLTACCFVPPVVETCSVQAFFVSPGIDHVIEQAIIAALDAAQESIYIALYSFTDDQLGDAVVRAHQRGVDVEILLDDGQEEAQGGEYPKLVAAGIPVKVEHVTGLLHHKFAVIDGELVITGSYNWSASADEKNFENVVFITCEEIVFDYIREFIRIWTALEAGRTP